MTNFLVTIITPCFNQGRFLNDALKSIYNQSYNNWECIVVNDGSDDNTETIAKEWCNKDSRFRYLRTDHQGPSAARNIGLENCSGQFIQFLDGDDIIKPEKLKLQIESLQGTGNNAISICDYFPSIENDLSKELQGRYTSPFFKSSDYLREMIVNWEYQLSIPIHCFLFNSNFFKENHIRFNENLPNHVDWECWMNIFKLNPEIRFVNEKLAIYRIQPGGICNNKELMKKGFLQAIDIQLYKFDNHSKEYGLLEKKINQVKYGVFSKNRIWIYIVVIYRNTRRLVGKILRNLKLLKPIAQISL
jgi:glycosyltransferase involved in cell wall biosynthesis